MSNQSIAEQALQAMFSELGTTIREVEAGTAVDVSDATSVTAAAERTARHAAAYAFLTWSRVYFLHSAMATAAAASEVGQ